ncbi:hypothetical protein HS048_21670 [Planomonospora sp. ID91781]|uniref:hypothetical protein n=1 Tax=Planomonospora sp. ID91781 TaxID=2738135 RepID=UPI0018C3AE92|nr:hypothetical protein [Planomonospora sp. ID91781]MBG0823342.1 hypothetical protein [Planomonospora sp. ID91781]
MNGRLNTSPGTARTRAVAMVNLALLIADDDRDEAIRLRHRTAEGRSRGVVAAGPGRPRR